MKNKYALFYAVHDRVKELELNIECYNRSDFLRGNFDVIVNCNSKYSHEKVFEIVKNFQTKNLTLILDNENLGSYMMGPMEQAASSYQEFLNYELIAQLHADVYLVKDFGVKNFISEFEKAEQKFDFYAFLLPNRVNAYAYDFWFMRPLAENNIFKDWYQYSLENDREQWCGEIYLYNKCKSMNREVGFLDRRPEAAMNSNYEESSGILHTKDFEYAKNFIHNNL